MTARTPAGSRSSSRSSRSSSGLATNKAGVRMIHMFALELLRLFSRPEKHHQFPNVYYRHCLDDHTQEVFRCVFCCPSFRLPLTLLSADHLLTLDLVALPPPSPTSPTPTKASPTATNTVHREADRGTELCVSRVPFLSTSRISQHWLTFYSALLSLHPPLGDGFR